MCPGYAAQCERPVLISLVIVLLIVFVPLLIVYRKEIVHGYKVRSLSKTIPHTSENFVGREDEMQVLLARVNFEFTEIRIINIVGSPGFGKSTLAIQLGHRLIDQGVYVHYVNMEDLLSGNIEQVLAEKILKSSDITAKTVTFDRLLQWARDKSGYTLLILDNCDNVLRFSFSNFMFAVRSLVQTSTQIKVIMTSRETVVHIEHYTWYKVDQLSPKAAISLLDMKLPKLKLSLKEKEKEEISELTGNVPLALHIVGSLLMLEDPPSPDTVIEELKSSPVQFLSPKKLPIQLRIDASISLSYSYLDDDLKGIALFLAFFSGSFSKDAAIEISKGLQDIKLPTNSTAKTLSVTQIELRALVDRSLLEYNERGGRYQYHRLIQEFLLGMELSDSDFEATVLVANNFHIGFRNYFLKKLHLNTLDFNFKYVDSLTFLDTEKHNIYIILNALSDPASLSRHSLLMTINYVTLAIDQGYLTCRFTNIELAKFFLKTVHYLDSNILEFQDYHGSKTITDLSGTTWTQREYYQRIYIQLLITYSDLLAKIFDEEYALNFMEQRKIIVDLLSDEKFQSCDCQQYEHKQEYVLSADNSEKPPTKFKSSSQSEPVRSPGSVPLSTKAQRRTFYINLSDRYLALGQHSKVAECQVKIIEEVKNCEQENCSYKNIGFMHWNIKNNEDAAKFLELSLEHDANNPISEAEILTKLFVIYKKIREWPWTSEDEQHTLSRMKSLCHKLMEMEDEVIFYNWNTIMTMMTVVNKIDKHFKVDFLEERMFSIMSTPNTEFQLKPKDALEIVKVVEQTNNCTKTLLWGSLLLQPFENYNNFSVEEKVNVLRIYLSTSKAKIKSRHFSEGLDGMEHVYKTIEQSLELQNHRDTYEMNSTACFYLIVRLKYVIPCYQDYLKKTAAAVTVLISSSIHNLPMNLAYIVFVVPLEFSSNIKASNNGAVVKMREPVRPSTDVAPTDSNMFGIQIVEDFVFTVVQSPWYNYISTHYSCWRRLILYFCVFSINVISVVIRLWVLCAFFAFITTVSLIVCTLFLETILAPLYNAVVLSPILPQAAREVFIALCDFLILSSKVQVQLLQNQVGFPWLLYYVHFSQLNLAQLYTSDYLQQLGFKFKNDEFFFIVSFVLFFPSIFVINPTIILLQKRKFVVFFVLVAIVLLCLSF